MRRSKIVIYLHIVWATKSRQPLITPEIERDLYRCIIEEVEKAQSEVLAIGGMSDHVHLFVKFPATLSVAEFVKRIKGTSSAFANDFQNHQSLFRWQEGYSVFSVSRSHREAIIAYVTNQKLHHADGSTYTSWEETDEEAPLR